MTASGNTHGPTSALQATTGLDQGAARWLGALAVAFLALIAFDTGYALRTNDVLAMSGDEAARDAFDQRTGMAIAAPAPTPHLQVALLQAADRDDRDLALLCAAQVPLAEGQPREVRLRFSDLRAMTRREIEGERDLEQYRRETGKGDGPRWNDDKVRAGRTARLPPGFSKSRADLSLRFTPRDVSEAGCRIQVERGEVFITCIDQLDEDFTSLQLDADRPYVMTIEDFRIVAVLRLAPEAVENEQLLAVAQWHEALGATTIPSASRQLPLEPQWWHGAVLLLGLLLFGVLAARAPVSVYVESDSPTRGTLLVMLLCMHLEFAGFAGALLALLLTSEWVHRPRSRRGAVPLLLFAVAITADALWIARWWQALPFVMGLEVFAVLGRRAALLLLGLWVLGDGARRGRAWFALAVVADLVCASSHHATAFGASTLTSRELHDYSQLVSAVGALGFLLFGRRRTPSAPHDEPAAVAPAST